LRLFDLPAQRRAMGVILAQATHWALVDRTFDRMGVNARMMEPEVVAAVHVRKTSGPA
jgi:hypothetical protein